MGSFDPPAGGSASAVLDNTQHIWGMPHWLRARTTIDFDAVIRHHAGVSDIGLWTPEQKAERVKRLGKRGSTLP